MGVSDAGAARARGLPRPAALPDVATARCVCARRCRRGRTERRRLAHFLLFFAPPPGGRRCTLAYFHLTACTSSAIYAINVFQHLGQLYCTPPSATRPRIVGDAVDFASCSYIILRNRWCDVEPLHTAPTTTTCADAQRTCRARGLNADTNADGGALAVAVVVDVADGDSAADSPRNGEPLARSAVAARGTDKIAAGCRRWRSCARGRSQVIRACTAYNAAKYGRRRAALRDALRDAEPDFEPNREPDCDPDCDPDCALTAITATQ